MFHPNDKAGPYTLVKFLGEGGFGQVWLAEKTTTLGTKLSVALKLLNLQLVDLDAIRQEAAVWETIKHHPHIVTLVDVEKYTVNGMEYVGIASLYMEAGSLADWLKRHGGRAPSVQAAVEMALGILDGLACLHEQTPPVIHRDLKPANILMQGEGPLLADFGLARALRSGKDYSHSLHGAGTLLYMAPESFDGEHSFRTDIWAVGVTLYQMLSGRLPFDNPDPPLLRKAIKEDTPPPLPASVPTRLHEIVAKSLAKDKTQRYQNVAALSADLQTYLTGSAARTQVDAEKTLPDAKAVKPEQKAGVRRKYAPLPAQPLWPIVAGIGAIAVLGVSLLGYSLSGYFTNSRNPAGGETSPAKPTGATSPAKPNADYTAVLPGDVKMEFMLIPSGNFKMGSPKSEQGRDNDEGPQHQVTFSREFYLGRYEVTQTQWQAVMGNNPSRFGNCAECPVENVSWDDAQQFIKKLNPQSDGGGKYRLPTEAEWEYAARAGEKGPYAGNLDEMGWYGNPRGKTHPVGEKKANKFGLYDMQGNVWEWCADRYYLYSGDAVTDSGPTSGGASGDAVTNPPGPTSGAIETKAAFDTGVGSGGAGGSGGPNQIARGGSWNYNAANVRSAKRGSFTPGLRSYYLGFRLVKE